MMGTLPCMAPDATKTIAFEGNVFPGHWFTFLRAGGFPGAFLASSRRLDGSARTRHDGENQHAALAPDPRIGGWRGHER